MSEFTPDDELSRRSIKQLKSSIAVKTYQKEWFRSITEKNKLGIPYGICGPDEAEEIFTAFGMPVVVITYWSGIIASKRMAGYYGNVLAKRGYDFDQYNSLGLGVTIDNNPQIAPWGGLPKPAIIVGSSPATQIWAREYGCYHFPLERIGGMGVVKPRWWERIRDHWDELTDPRVLDFRVEQEKALIRFIETITGLRFSIARLKQVLNLINEQEDYWSKARDLIASTIPCPVSLPDQMAMYPAQWFRGTPEARDLIKAYYEEVKERVEHGKAAYPDEKIRLMWIGAGLWTNTAFYQYFEEKYGAVFVCSIYTSTGADCYYRAILNDDPLRSMASRHSMLGNGDPAWLVKEAKLHQCDGVVGFSSGSGSAIGTEPFEKAGIPALEIPGHNVDNRQWKDEEIKSIVSNFIENRLLTKK